MAPHFVPLSHDLLTTSGYLQAFSATMKKVAETPHWARMSRIRGGIDRIRPIIKGQGNLIAASPSATHRGSATGSTISGNSAHTANNPRIRPSNSSKSIAAPRLFDVFDLGAKSEFSRILFVATFDHLCLADLRLPLGHQSSHYQGGTGP